MRQAVSFSNHTNGPINYVDYDADEQIAESYAGSYAGQVPPLAPERGFKAAMLRNLSAVIGLALIALAALGALALATWSIMDPSLNYAADTPVQNALGSPGAIIADLQFQFFGLGAIIWLMGLVVGGWRLLFHHGLARPKRRFAFLALGAVLASGALSALPVTQNWPLPIGMGGVVGDFVIWLPVAAFGSYFAGFVGLVTAALLGIGASLAFAVAAWNYKPGSDGLDETLQADHPALTYQGYEGGYGHAVYDDFEEDKPSRLAALITLPMGALAHMGLAMRAGLVRRLGGLMARRTAQIRDIASAGPNPTSAQDWSDAEWAAYEEEQADYAADFSQHVPHGHISQAHTMVQDVDHNAHHGQMEDWAPPLDQPYDEDTNAFIAPDRTPVAPAVPQADPFAPVVTPIAPRPQADMPAGLDPQARRVKPLKKSKPSARAHREAQADLLGSQGAYELPPLHLLTEPDRRKIGSAINADALEQNARLLEGVLEDFGVRGEIINVRPGPVVTLYELEPAPGIKSSRVIGLADDIARSMSAIAARVAVIPGRNAIGIELPNAKRETVLLRELLDSTDFEKSKAKLALCLGKTIGGESVIADLAKMPHLLVAGTTGSGKSVSINTMILSILYRMTPEECRLIMIDPKMLELSVYDGIPHLLTPVVTDPKKAVVALKWTVREMEDRYKKMSKLGVRNIDGFNARVKQAAKKGEVITRTVQTGFDHETGEAIYEQEELNLEAMPYMVVIIDEMADLMMVAGKEIEGTVQRLAQMARAAGIHVIMATQRPSVDVITGTIKANFPTRISFQVTSKIDSRTILGEQGAEQLLGMGDMLYMAGGGRIQRVHGPFVDDKEVEEIVAHLQAQGVPEYLDAITNEDEVESSPVLDAMTGNVGSGGEDELYDQAVAIVLRDKKVSTSYVQRRLSIGYNKAASIIERMEQEGVISAANHAGKREILVGNAEETI